MAKTRLIALTNGTNLSDYTEIYETNAPAERLQELESISNDVYINGGYEDDVPIWAEVLNEDSYIFHFIDDCENASEFGTAAEWLKWEYPEVIEKYCIENHPELQSKGE